MPFGTIVDGSPVVIVSTAAELQQAYATLSTTSGGGTILLSDDYPSRAEINLTGGGSQPVHITSVNTDDPVQISRIAFDDVDNVKVSGVHVDSTGVSRDDYLQDIDIDYSSRIEISDVTFTSTGTEFYDPNDPNAVLGERLGMIQDSSDVAISGIEGSGYSMGLTFRDCDNVDVVGNELYAMQGDALRFVDTSHIMVADNYFHDFSGTTNEVNHADFVQLWPTSTTEVMRDITIVGNVFDTGDGSSVQGIYFGMPNSVQATGQNYQDVTVSDNLIYTASSNGIRIGSGTNITIENNTVLYNSDAYVVKASGNTSYEPRIVIGDQVTNATITDNITSKLVFNGIGEVSGNYELSYRSSSDSSYVDNHFVNVADGGAIGPEGYQLLDSSPLVGKGASVSQPGGAGDWTGGTVEVPVDTVVDVVVDPEPTPEPAPAPKPTPEPTPEPDAGIVDVDNPETLLAVDFNGRVVDDLSSYDSTFRDADNRFVVADGEDYGYRIGSGNFLRMDVGNEQIHSLSSFGFEMDIRLLDPTDSGRFLHFPRSFEASIARDGTIVFSLTTDQGTFEVTSGDVTLDDLNTHSFAVGYDSNAGLLSMSIDGEIVGKVEASGTTGDGAFHGLTVGSIWGNDVDAVVDDIYFGTDPKDAGVDLALGVGETYVPAPDEPDNDISSPVLPPSDGSILDPEVPIDPQTAFFAIDFESGVEDLSQFDSRMKIADEANLTASDTGTGYRIGEGEVLSLHHRGNDQTTELDGFGLRLDIALLDPTDSGRFVHFPRTFEALIEEDRSVTFQLETSDGMFRVNSGDVGITDTDNHAIAIGYDSEAGRLTMEIDGQVVDSVAASGQTGSGGYHGFTVGSNWGDGVEAVVDNIWFGPDAESVGVDVNAGLFHAILSTATEADTADAALVEDEIVDDLLMMA
ncbi:hypothetical protein HKCCE3408_17190 [Rhodobacterales bacterium HKCCE3408]|nr:hypothetical protein [Rhodobacterales bacterium HKCCE3408]